MGRIYGCVQRTHASVFGWSRSRRAALTGPSGFVSDSQESSFPVVTDTKAPWSDEETLNLLDIWGKDSVQRALKGCLKNRHIFTQIAQKMVERGYMRSVEQCQTRIKRLKKYFRQNNRWVSHGRLPLPSESRCWTVLGETVQAEAARAEPFPCRVIQPQRELQDGV